MKHRKEYGNQEIKHRQFYSAVNFSISQFLNFFRANRRQLDVFQVSCFRFHATRPARAGFTMVEIVIMLAIIISISAIVLVSFPNVSGNINIQRSSQRFALALREAQSHALAVREVEGPLGPVIPKRIGVSVSSGSGGYTLFADIDGNRIYNAGDISIEVKPLERGVRFISVLDELGQQQQVANVTFSVPNAKIYLYNDTEQIGETVLFTMHAEGTFSDRSVRIRTSGQISTE